MTDTDCRESLSDFTGLDGETPVISHDNPYDRLYDVAHARTGDKGDTVNAVVVPFDDGDYERVVRAVAPERVEAHFGDLVTGPVERHPVPGLSCVNLVIEGALAGGVTRSLRLDRHGKTLSQYLLTLPLAD